MRDVNMFRREEVPYTEAIFDCGRRSGFSVYEGGDASDGSIFSGGGS